MSGSCVEKNVPIEVNGEELLVKVYYFLQPPEDGHPNWGIEIEEVTVDGIVFELTDGQIEQVAQYIIGRLDQ